MSEDFEQVESEDINEVDVDTTTDELDDNSDNCLATYDKPNDDEADLGIDPAKVILIDPVKVIVGGAAAVGVGVLIAKLRKPVAEKIRSISNKAVSNYISKMSDDEKLDLVKQLEDEEKEN